MHCAYFTLVYHIVVIFLKFAISMSEFKIRAVGSFSDQTSLIVFIIIIHALNFVHAFSKDCSIRVQFTVSVF